MNQNIQKYVTTTNTYITDHKKQFTVGTIVAVIILVIILIVALIQFNTPKPPTIVYQPTIACNLLTSTKAKELLGSQVIAGNAAKDPVLSSDNTATSNCSYTDSNPDTNNLMLAAVAVRSGINDQGVKLNKTEFNAKKVSNSAESIGDIGDDAWFDKTTGQLNVLRGRDWIILSYGVGSTPEANTIDKAVELARKILGVPSKQA